jgi:RNase adapter protein RapZ
MIYSFGYKHGPPEAEGHQITPDYLTVDVRKLLSNPYHDKKLRPLRGDHLEAIKYIEDETPNLDETYRGIRIMVRSYLQEYPGKDILVGCTGGHHRSVYMANRLGKDLGIGVSHLHYNLK